MTPDEAAEIREAIEKHVRRIDRHGVEGRLVGGDDGDTYRVLVVRGADLDEGLARVFALLDGTEQDT